jgi:malonyl-CoA decarboxylase
VVRRRSSRCARPSVAARAHPDLAVIDSDLTHLLGSWFNRGFLRLARIDWRTPAAILEKLITYEAVHEIQGFPDLKRRLATTAAASPSSIPVLDDEPLIFVEVAFVDEMPRRVGRSSSSRAPWATRARRAARSSTPSRARSRGCAASPSATSSSSRWPRICTTSSPT